MDTFNRILTVVVVGLARTWDVITGAAGQLLALAGKHKRIAVPVVAVLPLLLMAVIWASRTPPPPDPNSQSDQQIAEYLASDQFASQPDENKARYLRDLNQSGRRRLGGLRGMEDEQRRRIWRNMRPAMHQMMQQRMDEYFDLPPEQQTAYLDEMIDRWPQARRPDRDSNARPRSRPTSRPSGQRRRRGLSPDRMKRRLQTTPPDVRAKRLEFFRALRDRMRARGLARGRGGRRRG